MPDIVTIARRTDLHAILRGIADNVRTGQRYTFAQPHTAAEVAATGRVASPNQFNLGLLLQILSETPNRAASLALAEAQLDRDARLGIHDSEISVIGTYVRIDSQESAMLARPHRGGQSPGGRNLPPEIASRYQDRCAAYLGLCIAHAVPRVPLVHVLRNVDETIRLGAESPSRMPYQIGGGNRSQGKSNWHRVGWKWMSEESSWMMRAALGFPLDVSEVEGDAISLGSTLALAHGGRKINEALGFPEAERRRLRTYVNQGGNWPAGWAAIARACRRWPKLAATFVVERYADGSLRAMLSETTNANKCGHVLADYRPANGGTVRLWYPGPYSSTNSLKAKAWQDRNWFVAQLAQGGKRMRMVRPNPGGLVYAMEFGPDGFRQLHPETEGE